MHLVFQTLCWYLLHEKSRSNVLKFVNRPIVVCWKLPSIRFEFQTSVSVGGRFDQGLLEFRPYTQFPTNSRKNNLSFSISPTRLKKKKKTQRKKLSTSFPHPAGPLLQSEKLFSPPEHEPQNRFPTFTIKTLINCPGTSLTSRDIPPPPTPQSPQFIYLLR